VSGKDFWLASAFGGTSYTTEAAAAAAAAE